MGLPTTAGPDLRRLQSLACLTAAFGALLAPHPLEAQERTHVLIVVGLGGAADYREEFHSQAAALYTALTERMRLPEQDVIYLGERVDVAPEMIRDRSTRANVLQVLGEIAQEAGPNDRVLVTLIGHGTTNSTGTGFNLSGPDLTPSDLQLGVIAFPTQSLALVHTGSGSGGWLASLSGPNRIIITATRTERELNATEFPQYFVEALAGEGADLDKDERISLLEAYIYAREEVARHYENENEMLTEHALLDDNGDGEGTHEADLDTTDGSLAATFRMGGPTAVTTDVTDDQELARLYEERNEIQTRIDQLRTVGAALPEDEYLAEMEELLVELALKNREIRQREGGGR
jgi:hypothetical protein